MTQINKFVNFLQIARPRGLFYFWSLPMLMTAYPTADAERRENKLDCDDEFRQEAERQAPEIIKQQLRGINPRDWYRSFISAGRLYCPNEIVMDAVMQDDESCDRYIELMTSDAAGPLMQASSKWFGEQESLSIYRAHLEGLSDDF